MEYFYNLNDLLYIGFTLLATIPWDIVAISSSPLEHLTISYPVHYSGRFETLNAIPRGFVISPYFLPSITPFYTNVSNPSTFTLGVRISAIHLTGLGDPF